MKIKHYNEMMSYLTRPGFNGGGSVKNKTVLPKRKPAAEVKRRQKINYEKIKQYLGEESQELIERELGFAVGGGVNPAQLKQRFMQLISSIQDADDAEIPSIVAQAKQIKNQIDELNKQLAPDRQIKIASQGLQFDNPLVDAARIKEAVKPVQGIKPLEAIKSITEDNPVLSEVPDFKRGDKGTLADEEEKLDPSKRVAVDPKGSVVQASMKMNTGETFEKLKNIFKSVEPDSYPEIKTEDEFAEGGRIGFTKGGSVALAKILNELPDGTEVTRDMVKKIIADNNIDVSVNNFFAKPSTTLKEGITLVKQKSRIKITPEILKEFDDYVKKTDLDIKSIGEKFGYKKTKTTGLDTNSLLYKEYVKAYGEPELGRFKKYRLTVDDPIVQARLDKVRELGSIKAAAKDLKIDRRALAKQVAKFDPELLEEIGAGQANIPNPEGKYDYSKVRAKYIKAMERTLLKMPGGQKTLDQTLALMDKIHAKNKIIAELTDAEILSNKKLMDAMRLDVTELKTSKPRLKFDRYKDLTDKELVEKIRELAETNQLFQVEHQIPINSQRTASLFPKNIQAAVGRVGGQIESMKKFVINNPDSPVVNDIDKFLKSQNVQIKGAAGQNIGYAKNIVFNSKTNTSEIVDRGLDIFQKSDGPVLGMNRFNPRLLDVRKLPQDIRNMTDVVRDLIKTPAGKRIARNVFKGLKLTGAGVAGEIAFAVPFALENYASGYDFDRSIGDLTFGAYGSTEEKDLRKSAGELGYATKTVTELEALMPEILNKLNTYDDVNDPRGEKRQQFENLYNYTADRYMKAYNLFVTDRGKFDKELWSQALNNFTAGVNQNEKFRAAKEKERGVKEASKNITGFELDLDLGFAGGGLAKQAGDESGKPPESGPTPDGPSKGLAYLFKNGMEEEE